MSLLLRGLSRVVTFDDEGREYTNADILIEGPRIAAVGSGLSDGGVDEVVEGRDLLALPGLINAHQHLYQGALRALPELERVSMGPWLAGVGARSLAWWREGRFGPEAVGAVARALLVESLLGGVTTVADQHYFFPGGATAPFVEATIEAASEVGIRLHACRGTITFGRSQGGAADDALVQTVDEVLRHSLELIERYHDPRPLARTRVALAPCGVHVDTPELFEQMAALASEHDGVRLHTHLYEKVDTEICAEKYGMTPWRFLELHGWATDRVWLAHVNDPPGPEIAEFAAAGVSVAHLIAPDLRLGWGAAPVRSFLDAGVAVGFGTTGSASNDGANLLGDLRVAALAHRSGIPEPARWLSARELLGMATTGSAECLGRPDLGSIAPGRAADIACWDLSGVDRIGVHDPVAGLLMTGLSDAAQLVVVNGEVLVRDGAPTRVDSQQVAAAARAAVPVAG